MTMYFTLSIFVKCRHLQRIRNNIIESPKHSVYFERIKNIQSMLKGQEQVIDKSLLVSRM